VTFSDLTSGGTPTTWNWAFDGGTPTTSTEQFPDVIYDSPGIYDVTLTVDDGNGPASQTVSQMIEVLTPPTASFTFSD